MGNILASPKGTFCSTFLLWGCQVMPSGSRCLSGHHHHPQGALAGAGGVEVTGTQGQAQWHLDDARAGGNGLWDPCIVPAACAGQVGTSAEPMSSHPTWIQPGQSFHFTPQILFFFHSQLCSD